MSDVIGRLNNESFKKLTEMIENPNENGLEIIAALINLPDEDFELLRPVMQESIIAAYEEPSIKLQMLQILAENGLTINDIINNTDEIIKTIFTQDSLELSDSKKSFLQFIFSSMATALSDSTFNPARFINIPVEICRENAKLPTYATNGAGAMDIYSPKEFSLDPGECKIIPIGIKVAIPHGYGILIQPRSGLSRRLKLRIPNSPGLIDEDYHDEIGVIVENIDPPMKDYKVDFDGASLLQGPLYGSPITIGKGERFAQMRLVEIPRIAWRQVPSIGTYDNDHGAGFGSTGTN